MIYSALSTVHIWCPKHGLQMVVPDGDAAVICIRCSEARGATAAT